MKRPSRVTTASLTLGCCACATYWFNIPAKYALAITVAWIAGIAVGYAWGGRSTEATEGLVEVETMKDYGVTFEVITGSRRRVVATVGGNRYSLGLGHWCDLETGYKLRDKELIEAIDAAQFLWEVAL